MLGGRLQPNPVHLAGVLSQASLVHALDVLFVGRHSGRLVFIRDDEELSLRFASGHVVSSSSGPVAGRLGEILIRSGILARADLNLALVQAAQEGRRLGPVLVERGLLTRGQVEEALRLQVRGAFFAAFCWGRGSYRFEPDQGSLPALDEVTPRLSTAQLILEAMNCLEQPFVRREARVDPLGRVTRPRMSFGGEARAHVLPRADGVLTATDARRTGSQGHEPVGGAGEAASWWRKTSHPSPDRFPVDR